MPRNLSQKTLTEIAARIYDSARENAAATHREQGGRGHWEEHAEADMWVRWSIDGCVDGVHHEEYGAPRALTDDEIRTVKSRARALHTGH